MERNLLLRRGLATSDPSYVFTHAYGMQPPWTVERIREVEAKTNVQVTGYDTTIESDDPAVVRPMLSELLLKIKHKDGKTDMTLDGEREHTRRIHHYCRVSRYR
jgi:hypothetical protein